MKLTDIQKDTLAEIANIAFGNASTAIFNLFKKRVEVGVPQLSECTVEEASDQIGLADEQVTEVLLKTSGDLSGIILIIIPPDQAKSIAPALTEVGNIIAGNALTALAKFLKLKVMHSIPDIATDMRRALVVSSVFLLGEQTDEVLILGTNFSIPSMPLLAKVYLLFDKEAAKKMMASL